MANRAGLRKVVKTVRGKKGSVRRSYWVRAGDAVKSGARAAGGFVGRHKGAIAGALLAATAIGLNAYGHRQAGTSNTGAYALERNAGKGRVRSALSAFGGGLGYGAQSAGYQARNSAQHAWNSAGRAVGSARESFNNWNETHGESMRVGLAEARVNAGNRMRTQAENASFSIAMARNAARGEYGEQRRAGTGRARSIFRAARGAMNTLRNA